MKRVFVTFDYELFFGHKTGTAEKSIIKPVNILREVAKKRNAKFIFFVDSGYLTKLKQYKEKYSYVRKEYDLIFKNVENLCNEGHDIQLHIHPHWEDSFFNGERWVLSTKRYRLHEFSKKEIDDIVFRYKNVLTDLVGDKVFAFRAGGLCIQPFETISNTLKRNNIFLDSSVFYGGYYNSDTHFFDFKNAPQKDMWRFEKNILKEDEDGFFIEVPITSIRLSPFFFWKLAMIKSFAKGSFKIYGDGKSLNTSTREIIKMLILFTNTYASCDGYRSSLLEKIYKYFYGKNFVIIGHPKTQCKYSINKLDNFLANKKTETFQKRFLVECHKKHN